MGMLDGDAAWGCLQVSCHASVAIKADSVYAFRVRSELRVFASRFRSKMSVFAPGAELTY